MLLPWRIVVAALHFCFNCATIVADSAVELGEVCLPHPCILCSFALFSTLDLHQVMNKYANIQESTFFRNRQWLIKAMYLKLGEIQQYDQNLCNRRQPYRLKICKP